MAVRRLFVPRELFYGWGAVESLRNWPGERALVVTDKIMMAQGHAEKVMGLLRERGFKTQAFDGVEPEPSRETIHRGAAQALEFSPDVIVGLGGGSCLDAGKMVWLFYENPPLMQADWSQLQEQARRAKLRQKARYAAIPSTSGTGSEATPVAVITNHEVKPPVKVIILNMGLLPDLSISDAQFPATMPPQVTADTGFDALVHALECYVVNPPSEFVDGLSLRAFQSIYRWLPRAVHQGQDKEARERVHTSATLAGLAICNGTLGIIHDMAHQLGSAFHISHGRANALMLDVGLAHLFPRAQTRFLEAAQAVGLQPRDSQDAFTRLLAALKELRRDIGIPLTIQGAGVTEETFMALLDTLASNTRTLPLRPLRESQEEVRELFLKAWQGEAL